MQSVDDVLRRILLTRVADLDTLFEEPEVQATVEAFAPTYVLVALPKSSSTYCTSALADILDAVVYKDIVVQDSCTPKDLSVAGIINERDRATLSQVHLVATGANLRILRHFRIKTAILLRNLFDVVVSLRDHMNANPYFSSILMPSDYSALSETDKLDYIIDAAVPWIVSFYVSWVQALKKGEIDTGFVLYEDMVREPVSFFQNACLHYGRSVKHNNVERSLTRVEKSEATRFNVGRVGRGREELRTSQMAHIRRHASYYPGIDFAPIGL